MKRLLTAGLLLALTGCSSFAAAEYATSTTPTHCLASEKVLFSCSTGTRTVSLCGHVSAGAIDTLAYRYGEPGKVEMEYAATPENGRHFSAASMPVGPRAQVRQVWWDRGSIRYLVTQCVGGDCPHQAGLAVLEKDGIMMESRCTRSEPDLAWFSPDLIHFGNETSTSSSKTPRLRMDDVDNGVDRFYGSGRE